MYNEHSEVSEIDYLINRYGEPITQFILDEIARAECRDTEAAAARACGLGGGHGGA